MTGGDPADQPPLDPAVSWERLGRPDSYPPGFYGTIRSRLPVFALVGALSVLVALIPFPQNHTREVLIAGAIFFFLSALATVLPWRRMPRWFWPLIPIGYLSVIALLRDAQGADAGLVALYFLPLVWLAYYGSRTQLAIGLAGVFAALALPILIVGAPEYPASNWRLVIVTVVTAGVVSFSALTMVNRDRAYVADMAEQSQYARDAADAALATRDQLAALLRAATETAIIGIDSHGIVTFFSRGAERMFGYHTDEVVGISSAFDFLDHDELSERVAELDVLAQRGASESAAATLGDESTWTYVRKDGSRRKGALTITPNTRGSDLQGFVIVVIDVTDRESLATERDRLLAVQREVTEILVEQNNRLRELTKMKDDVVATVSHELRTPLTSIRGFIELLLDKGASPLDPEQEKMLRTIDRNSLQLLAVADDLLADPGGARGLRVHFSDTNLSEVAADAVHAISSQARIRDIVLGCEALQPVIVYGDASRLHQLLDNLLSNAMKFTPPRGRVRVQVDVLDRFARLEVLDDGPGIPFAERSQLFERFYRLASTTKKGIPGTGLGLAISKSIVEAHEGTVDIVDTPGWSTTFRVLLPLALPAGSVESSNETAAID
jgi:PAS domain S-box-containing protein